MAHLLPPRKLRPNLLWMDSRVNPGDKKVIEHIRALGDETSVIPCHRFDQAFDEFLAELLNHLGGTPGKQFRRVAYRGVEILPAVNDLPETIEYVRTCTNSFRGFFICALLACLWRRRFLLFRGFGHIRRSEKTKRNRPPVRGRKRIL